MTAPDRIFDSENHVQIIGDVVPAGLLIIRVQDGRVVFSNRSFEELLGDNGSEVFGASWEQFFADPEDRQQLMLSFVANEEVRNRELKLIGKNGKVIWGLVSISSVAINDEDYLLFAFSDVTPLKNAMMEIEHLANHDNLTGLPTVRLLEDRISHAILQADRQQTQLAIMFVDLDGFKSVNDSLGHETGDIVLKESARRMVKCVRGSDTVARIGGDEFVILLDSHDQQTTEGIANRVVRELGCPIQTAAGSATIGASVGVSCYPANGDTPKKLIKAADDAMYKVKKDTKGGVAFA